MENFEQDSIHKIFSENFNIKEIDPKEYTLEYMATAIVHDPKNIDILDKYLSTQDYIIILEALKYQRKLEDVLRTVDIKGNMEIAFKKIISSIDHYSIEKNYIIFATKLSNCKYQDKDGQIFNYVGDRSSAIYIREFLCFLSKNKTLSFMMIQELEKLLKTCLHYEIANNDQQKEILTKHLDELKRHPNYSVAEEILKQIKQEA